VEGPSPDSTLALRVADLAAAVRGGPRRCPPWALLWPAWILEGRDHSLVGYYARAGSMGLLSVLVLAFAAVQAVARRRA
jgi:hypothetical protein